MTGHKVLIVPVLAQVMQQHIKATSKQPNPYNLLFHKVDVSVIDPKQNVANFRTLIKLAHIPNSESHSSHETRYSVVPLLASMGVDAQLIKEIVGHSSDALVEHYNHTDDSESFKARPWMRAWV